MTRVFAIGVAVLCAVTGCGTSPEPLAAEKRSALEHLGRDVVVPTLAQFSEEAAALKSAVDAWATARAKGPAEAERTAAQEALRTALLTWERAELFQFGPAGQMGRFTGGQSLRGGIYSWPAVNACQIDTLLVNGDYAPNEKLAQALVTVRGLGALERLVFAKSAQNACPPEATINSSGSWGALDAQTLEDRRAAYAQAAAALIEADARKLHAAWTDGFADQLGTAGQTGSGFTDAQAGLNEVFAGLLYLDGRVKDDKLGAPAGIDPACTRAVCPELAEAESADVSHRAVAQNLRAAQALFRGSWDGQDQGFDRLLRLRGAEPLATTMDQQLADAVAKAEALTVPVEIAVTQDLERVKALHAAVKAVTDVMKSQMVTTLSLKPPDQGAGDND